MRQKLTQSHLLTSIKISLAGPIGLIIVFILSQLTSLPSQATPVLSVSGTGSNTYPGQETTYRLELLNHTDQIVYDGILTATLPVSFTYVPGSTIAMGEGWPMESREPIIDGQTLTWGPYHLPAAGVQVYNPYGIHTLMDSCDGIPALHLEGAKTLVGNGGYITQLFYPIDINTTGPGQCAVNYVQEAYARNLIPIFRLQGHRLNGIWQAPDPGPDGDYSEIARAYANYVAGLPRRNTNPLYIAVWNEPDLWIEWSGQPNATQYARFFVAVSKAIRQLGDARIRVVNGALTPGNTTFLDQMLRVPGFRDAFDVWASHCYPYNHPAWYNSHSGAARYGTYAIDCYLEELAVINAYGRAGVKVMLTETGYPLGDNTFGFEGFPTVNETNRADYIAGAFSDYWQNRQLFAADAEHDRLLVFNADLSQQVAGRKLNHQPDQLILDSATRRLYLSFPAASQVMAINAGSLTVAAQAKVVGGPLLDLAFDANRSRLYALGVLAPGHHGITVWETPALAPMTLIAGSVDFPLQKASALALTSDGNLLISEIGGLWQITPNTFAVTHSYPANNLAPIGGLSAHQNSKTIYGLDPRSNLLRIYQ